MAFESHNPAHTAAPADPALVERLRTGDAGVRAAAARALAASRPHSEPGWVKRAVAAFELEADPDAATALATLLGQADAYGTVPLEAHLEANGAAARRGMARALDRVLDVPEVFAAAFAGLLNPHRRALAGTLHEMAQVDGTRLSAALTRCLYARDPHVQRVGLTALLEVPEEVARPILAQFPEELALPEAAEAFRDVNGTFEIRRTFRNQAVTYQPVRSLGQGGMGAVWLARDLKRPPRLAALKFLKPGADGQIDPELLGRFNREARVPLLLNHPGLLRVFDFGQQSDFHWIDVDFIQGHNVQELLDREGSVDWQRAVWIALQLADALDYLHRKRIIHRDLKPANLFIARDPHRVVLGDFGLVQIGDEQVQAAIPNYAPTQAHLILGTVGYMSPEQATSSPIDGRSDLFGLGAIIYRAIAGRLPYPASSFREYMKALNASEPPAPLPPDVPRPLADLVMQLLERDGERRPADAASVAERLRALGPLTPQASATGVLRPHTGERGGIATTAGALPSPEPASPPPVFAGRVTGRTKALPEVVEEVVPEVEPDAVTTVMSAPVPLTLQEEVAAIAALPLPSEPPAPPAPVAESHAPGPVSSSAAAFAAAYASAGSAGAGLRRPDAGAVRKPGNRPKFDGHEGSSPSVARPPPASGEAGWCSACHATTPSALEGCIKCRLRATPWPPQALQWVAAAFAVWCLAPLVLDRIPGAPRVRPPLVSHALSACAGAGALGLAHGLGRLGNWAYCTGTALLALFGLSAGGVAALLARPAGPPPAVLAALMRFAGIDPTRVNAGYGLRALRYYHETPLALAGGASLILALCLLGSASRHHFRRNWTTGAIAAAVVCAALILGPLAMLARARWSNLPLV